MGTRAVDRTYNMNGGFLPVTKRSADLAGPDFYPTPRWATFALTEVEAFTGPIWDPACGDGAMAEVLTEAGYRVICSDLYDHCFGETGHDFLTTTRHAANIVTNPPYHSAEGFVARALQAADRKFALLLRLAFLEGANRANTIFHRTPPSRVWVFSERVTFYRKGATVAGGGTTAYAWFVWDRDKAGATELRWLKPGTKAKFSTRGADALPMPEVSAQTCTAPLEPDRRYIRRRSLDRAEDGAAQTRKAIR